MPEQFLLLKSEERKEILDTAAASSKFPAAILEKDVWVCWSLQAIFSNPDKDKMAFKGGTSLSKAYDAINRFSEDVDITIDYRNKANVQLESLSRNYREKKLKSQLVDYLDQHVSNVIYPYLLSKTEKEFGKGKVQLQLIKNLEDAEVSITLTYESATEILANFNKDVKLEFGARNVTDPNDECEIITYLARQHYQGLDLPKSFITVLSPQRTFWEKVTLIHGQCNFPSSKKKAERMSRHWYDLAMLCGHSIGIQSLENKQLMEEVIKLKQMLYRDNKANYGDCLNKKFCLIPVNENLKQELRNDYQGMKIAGYFMNDPPTFDAIMKTLSNLQNQLNS